MSAAESRITNSEAVTLVARWVAGREADTSIRQAAAMSVAGPDDGAPSLCGIIRVTFPAGGLAILIHAPDELRMIAQGLTEAASQIEAHVAEATRRGLANATKRGAA